MYPAVNTLHQYGMACQALSNKDLTSTYQHIVELLLLRQSVQSLAEEMQVTRQTVHAWRTGRRPNPKQRQQLIDRLIALSEQILKRG